MRIEGGERCEGRVWVRIEGRDGCEGRVRLEGGGGDGGRVGEEEGERVKAGGG